MKNVVLVDDRVHFIKHSGTKGIQFGRVYSQFDTWGLAHEAKKHVKPELMKWVPPSRDEWLRDRNRFARINAILEQALDDVQNGSKRSFADLVGQYDQQPEKAWIERGLRELSPKSGTCLQQTLNLLIK